MEVWKDRRVVIGAGVAVAVVLGLLLVAHLLHTQKSNEPPPADQANMVIRQGRPDDAKLDPKRELGCFVGGQYVGLATWADCAKRNGVATGDLDVGIDSQGGLAGAAPNAGAGLVPLPPDSSNTAPAAQTPPAAPAATPSAPPPPQPIQTSSAGGQACWRFSDRTWYRMAEMPMGACIQTLFAGRCEHAGSATYGRWGDQTLRLVPGRVEASDDNRSFHQVAEQTPNCAIPTS
jgi:hypothetical protein